MPTKTKVQKATKNLSAKEMEVVFSLVADYFTVLSEPSRLRVMYAICNGEKTVSETVAVSGLSQANVSRHLTVLYRAGILLRRKEGTSVYYAIADHATIDMCQTVCTKIAQSLH